MQTSPSANDNHISQSIIAFEIGKTYYGRHICDYDSIEKLTIIKRTPKSVWVDYHGDVKMLRIKQYNGSEYINPDGTYSMALSIYAKDCL